MDTHFEVSPGAECAVVRARGPLNLITALKLKGLLAQLVQTGHRRLVIDLAGVPFIDTSGLGALISGLKVARTAGGDMRLTGADSRARQLLAMTSLDRVLAVDDTVEDALEALARRTRSEPSTHTAA